MGELQGPRSLEDAKKWMLDRLQRRVHPLGLTDVECTRAVINELEGLDGETWARAWSKEGERFFALATDLEARGETGKARDNYYQAYGFFFLARFPSPTHPDKLAAYQRELDAYAAYGRLCTPSLTVHRLPLEGEGEVTFYFRQPATGGPFPAVVMWGGVDAWKEEMTALSEAFLAEGIATIALDNVGTGQSPIKADRSGERQFLPVLDWVEANSDCRDGALAILGRSFGGHWATKLAHQFPGRFRGAVNWGGGVHHMFQRDWIEKSRFPDTYLMDLVETRSRMLGATNDEEYALGFEQLSLLDQGLLDGPCAPMLLVNGRNDTQCPPADIDILLDHGDPKAVRLFPGGHMGFGPHTVPTIVRWVKKQLLFWDQAETDHV
ncbi:alpha/beta hydrolase family protein [Cucumibacter marinus]|uniref:alpha/beta hydrolase family protein n=1 Tax=Cucumibacter marinus TaxID=1121252 RepID=UPI000403378E|nr:alpha/beta hydrolase [Cucumibacter marinus]